MSVPQKSSDLGAQLAAALAYVEQAHLPFVATPAATRLELDLGAFMSFDADDRSSRIHYVEDERVIARPFPLSPADRDTTPVRYFLDGVQRTIPLGWCGMSTLALAVVVVGVIERRPQDGVFHAVHGMTDVQSNVIIAAAPGEQTDALCASFTRAGLDIDLCTDDAPVSRPGDYIALQACLRPAVNRFRAGCERAALGRWVSRYAGTDAWLLMDGRLPDGSTPHVIGLIKQHHHFALDGDEMLAVLTLAKGTRTSAFRRDAKAATTWYARLHDGTGLDPLHGLVRIEAASGVTTGDAIDTITRHVYAERTPRATADTRWPTLLYPIHIAERILKTKLDRATLGVPAALRHHLREVA